MYKYPTSLNSPSLFPGLFKKTPWDFVHLEESQNSRHKTALKNYQQATDEYVLKTLSRMAPERRPQALFVIQKTLEYKNALKHNVSPKDCPGIAAFYNRPESPEKAPEQISLSEKLMTDIAVGQKYLCLLDSSGIVYGMGNNEQGQLGFDRNLVGEKITNCDTLRPLDLNLAPTETATAIATGLHHTLVATTLGVWGFGNNEKKQLGLNYKLDKEEPKVQRTPQRIEFFNEKTIFAVTAAQEHSLVLAEDGLYGFGDPSEGVLGTGTYDDYTRNSAYATPQRVIFQIGIRVLQVSTSGSPSSDNDDPLGPINRGAHTIVLTTDGVYAWGNNQFDQLGLGICTLLTHNSPQKICFFDDKVVLSVTAGWRCSFVLTTEGLYTFGCNQYGKLGFYEIRYDITGVFKNVSTPRKIILPGPPEMILEVVSRTHQTLVRTTQSVYIAGLFPPGFYRQPQTSSGFSKISLFQGTNIHKVALLCCGDWSKPKRSDVTGILGATTCLKAHNS